jgi:hypothetical protein
VQRACEREAAPHRGCVGLAQGWQPQRGVAEGRGCRASPRRDTSGRKRGSCTSPTASSSRHLPLGLIPNLTGDAHPRLPRFRA